MILQVAVGQIYLSQFIYYLFMSLLISIYVMLYYSKVEKSLKKLNTIKLIVVGGGQKSKILHRAPTEPGPA